MRFNCSRRCSARVDEFKAWDAPLPEINLDHYCVLLNKPKHIKIKTRTRSMACALSFLFTVDLVRLPAQLHESMKLVMPHVTRCVSVNANDTNSASLGLMVFVCSLEYNVMNSHSFLKPGAS